MSSNSNSHPAISSLLTNVGLKSDRSSNLEGIPLIRRAVREFLKVLETQARPSPREHCAKSKSQRVDAVAFLRLGQRNPRPGPGAGLTLLVTGQSSLKVQAAGPSKRSHQRIIEIERLARVNASAFLAGVKFVHLKGGAGNRAIVCQIDGLTRRHDMRPVP